MNRATEERDKLIRQCQSNQEQFVNILDDMQDTLIEIGTSQDFHRYNDFLSQCHQRANRLHGLFLERRPL